MEEGRVVKAYKFLAAGAKAPITGFQWPVPQLEAPGAWVEAAGPLEPCARGAHVCRANELAFWLHDELWELEIEGERMEGYDCVVVERARLVRRLDDWQHGGAARFARASVEHAAEQLAQAPERDAVQQYLEDATECEEAGEVAAAAFCAAVAVANLAPGGREAAFRRERAWQSTFIARMSIGVP